MVRIHSNVYIPKQKEEAYGKKSGLVVRRLANGFIILGMLRKVQDSEHTRIDFSFPTGSYFDPLSKKGIHHMLEHMVTDGPMKAAEKYDAQGNAVTSYDTITIRLAGVSNPRVKSYGIWKSLSLLHTALVKPLDTVNDLLLEKEKDVVREEMYKCYSDPFWHISRIHNSFIYKEDNPVATDGLGTEEGLNATSLQDLKKLAQRVFVPKETIISIFSEGSERAFGMLLGEIEALFSKFPRSKQKPFKVAKKLFNKFNPDFKPEKVYIKGTGIKNGQTEISYIWIFPNKEYSTSSFALSRLLHRMNQVFFNYLRETGMVYTAGAARVDTGDYSIVSLNFLTGKRFENIAKTMQSDLYPKIKKAVFGTFDKAYLKEINKRELEIQEAVPLSCENRLGYAWRGIYDKGLLIDADKVKELYKNVTIQDLQKWVDRFTATPPAIIITGDIE